MKYKFSDFWTAKAREIAKSIGLGFFDLERVTVVESIGSKSRRVIARIHTMGKVMQLGMNQKPFYVIELITEHFNRQCEEEKTKTIIHELLHIPHSFGGGFRHHKGYVNTHTVEEAYKLLLAQTTIQPTPTNGLLDINKSHF